MIGIVLDHLDYVAFARMAVFVCTFLEKMARAVPVLQPKMSLSKSNARTSRCCEREKEPQRAAVSRYTDRSYGSDMQHHTHYDSCYSSSDLY